MKYLHTMVRVSDIGKSLDFYCSMLGLVEVRRFDSERGRFTLIFLGARGDEDAQIELTYNWDPEDYDEGRNFGHLAYQVDDIYATVMRQAYFVRFEVAAHEAVRAGRSAEHLGDLYWETLTEQFGDALDLSEEFRHEWLTIPHIYHTPFYCYAYCFGQLLVLALYQRYKEQGAAFVPGYLKLLATGGSARPETMLAEVGVDITDADFWRGGFAVVDEMVTELEAS